MIIILDHARNANTIQPYYTYFILVHSGGKYDIDNDHYSLIKYKRSVTQCLIADIDNKTKYHRNSHYYSTKMKRWNIYIISR